MQLLLQFLFMAGRYLCNPERSIYSQHTGFKSDRPVLSRQQHGQHQSLGFLRKRGKTTSCFCSPCFSQQFVVPALCYPSGVEWHLQLPPLRSVPPESFLEKGNPHCSRPLLTPPVLKPIKTKSEVMSWHLQPKSTPQGEKPDFFVAVQTVGLLHTSLFSQEVWQNAFATALTFFSCSLANRHSCTCSFSSSISFLAVSSFSTAWLWLASMSSCNWCTCSKAASWSGKGETCLITVLHIRWEFLIHFVCHEDRKPGERQRENVQLLVNNKPFWKFQEIKYGREIQKNYNLPGKARTRDCT